MNLVAISKETFDGWIRSVEVDCYENKLASLIHLADTEYAIAKLNTLPSALVPDFMQNDFDGENGWKND
jgi:hypothetical protein